MLRLTRTSDEVDLVCVADEAVEAPEGAGPFDWIVASRAHLANGATVARVRPLSHREIIDCELDSDAASLNASERGLVSLSDGVSIERLPLAVRTALGGWIINASALPADPT